MGIGSISNGNNIKYKDQLITGLMKEVAPISACYYKQIYYRLFLSAPVSYAHLPYVRFVGDNSNFYIKPRYSNTGSLEYSFDTTTWTTIQSGNETPTGKIIYMRGKMDSAALFTSGVSSNMWKFFNTSRVEIYGSLNRLLDYENDITTLEDDCFSNMFLDCSNLTIPPELPATTLGDNTYGYMFTSCTNLKKAPILPATTIGENCYAGMFSYCTSLKKPPALPATSLGVGCYLNMFGNCISLEEVPTLPATILQDNCYYMMFENCESLLNTPDLPALVATDNCYYGMFMGCTSLEINSATMLPATTLGNSCYREMFSGCTSTAGPPILPALTLTDYCYAEMLAGCTNIKVQTTQKGPDFIRVPWRIPYSTEDGTMGQGSLDDMLLNTGGAITGTPSINTQYYWGN
ncbi:MAG: leucine-rich repeat domain-containing protein [Endomicrobium sp.]|jgi:hypothetical protein|uniref:leucine-rich repeat protein n=1 Tax=Candidatus Endomicrobiellum cubanum TaxID=3242325 RepID=UPI00282F0C6F|nr:leucine-rich repeat domain-containing protein [Endomicrobium sp.]